jgi:predicted kinase
MLIVFGGLPGTGKTTIARELARQVHGLYLRIDTIEQGVRESGLVKQEMNEVGYLVAYAVAEENLCLGRIVIADSVNPLQLTRDAWVDVAKRADAQCAEVEIVCSDQGTHRRRLETRSADIQGLKLSWQEVLDREYNAWNRKHIVIDTAGRSVSECVEQLRKELPPISQEGEARVKAAPDRLKPEHR